MALISLTFLVILLTIFCLSGMVEPACRRCSRSRAFVEKQCEATLYTRLCIQGLLPFVNSRIQTQQQLAQVALSSVKEFRQMSVDGEKQFLWHESNVQSWVSAALTDATACIDGFSTYSINSRVKATIKAKVLNVAQVTSNALALFNGYTARQRASFRAKKP
ncbi:hypothetical protein AG4045_021509 [Apium graveolens]|uniref:Pectinesterase inhibitor domain-containing protein n=1 Tax=Apium graveolens TaxID=4045 RepID=A0A6L5B9Y1_APIGR|nr:hypothetical protein AG4045_021509 [Apium graveolens]